MRFLLVEEDNKKKDNYLVERGDPQSTSSNKLNEGLHSLGSNCFITDSPYDIRNLIMNKPKLYRILYDSNIDMYMIGDGNQIIHWDMLRAAYKQGYYANQEEFIEELGGALDNYVETGIYGLYDDDYEVDPYLLYMVFSPNDDFGIGEDGYDGELKFNFGSLLLREADQGLMDNCDLIRILQKQSWANESMELNEDISLQDKHAVRGFADECKIDELPLMDYKEFSELLNEQGMKPNEELYQVYVDAYNNEEDTDYIEVIKNKFEKMSSNEIIDLLGIPNSSNIDSDSPMFLLPNGSIISVAQAGKLIGQELSDNVHSDIVYVILSAIANKYNYDWDMDDGYYEERKLSFLTYELGWARLNCGETWAEERFYCVLPNHMTSAQYRSLEKWLEWGLDTGKKEVLVYVGSYQDNNTYSFKDNLPEDIIKKIKRYYSSGKLYESELKENMNEEFVNNLIPGELYHFIHNNKILYGTFKRKTPAWLFFDVDGKEVLAKPWTSIATTAEELEELMGLVDKMEKDTKVPSQVPNRFTRVPNQHNKPMGESNMDYHKDKLTKITNNIATKIINDGWYKEYDDETILYNEVVDFVQDILHSDNQDNYISDNDYEFIKDETDVAGIRNKNAYGGGKYEFDIDFCDKVANKVLELSRVKNESNELEQRAKKHKKKSKGMGWHMSFNAGDVEKGIEVFNNSTSLGSGTSGGEGAAMGEDLEKHLYYYDGPIYYRGNKISTFSNIYTTAKSFGEATRNILFKAAKGDKELWHYDIVDDEIKQMPKGKLERPKCQQCGYEINDNGDCPICDYGEDDLLESLSDLEALWTLRNLD